MKVDIRVREDAALRRLSGIGARMIDARPVFEDILDDLLADGRRRFDTQGFGRWPKLDPDTIRAKSRAGHDPRILHATGTLRRALTQRHAPGQRLDIGPTEMTFGLSPSGLAYYGRFHQLGKGVPKRLVIAATPFRRKAISERVRSFIVNTR